MFANQAPVPMHQSAPMHQTMPTRRPASSDAKNDALLAKAAGFGLPLFDLSAFDLGCLPDGLADQEAVRRDRALPLAKHGDRLFVAIADPANLGALDEIRFRTGLEAAPVLVAADRLDEAIARCGASGGDALLATAEEAETTPAAELADASAAVDAVAEAPVVKYVQQVLVDAIDAGASDIHFEPYEGFYRIRLRIDGVLREARRPPPHWSARLAARLKVMAQMDVAEHRLPQDGRLRLALADNSIDFRASTLPTRHGEKVVLRVLDSSATGLAIDQLGFEDEQRRLFLAALRKPQGMVLATGPTGSGKTVTLYAGLSILNADDRNLATAEDPVEINIDGVNQVQVNPKIGLDFASALRAFLRQDPDVLMVGEIRDPITAETAVKAAQTGHLVLSTLHTNSAAETLTRLRDIGVPAYSLATSVSLIVAQRLVRRLCQNCKIPSRMPVEALLAEGFTAAEVDAGVHLFNAEESGCDACSRGYRGRIGIHEVVPIVPELQRLILADGDSLTLAERARALGFDGLRRSGLQKALRGLTSLREVNRVAG